MEHKSQEYIDSVRPASVYQDNGITLLDMLLLFVRRRWLILGLTLLGASIAAGIAWSLPDIYTANVKVAVPKIGAGPFVAALQSDEMAYAIIDKLDLTSHYGQANRADARFTLKGRVRFNAGKDGLVGIEVDDTDPQAAAKMVQAFVDQLIKMATDRYITESAQFRRALTLHKAKAEERAAARAKDDVEALIPQETRFLIWLLADLRAELALALGDPTTVRTDAIRMQDAVVRLERQLQQIKAFPSTAASLDQQQRYQDLLFYRALTSKLGRQIEIAAANEAMEVRPVSAVVPPDRKSKPHRAVIVALAAVVTLILACTLVFILEQIKARAGASDRGGALQRLGDAWRGDR